VHQFSNVNKSLHSELVKMALVRTLRNAFGAGQRIWVALVWVALVRTLRTAYDTGQRLWVLVRAHDVSFTLWPLWVRLRLSNKSEARLEISLQCPYA
jgi:hypothetical protein